MVFKKTKTVPFSNKDVYGKQFRPGIKLVFPVVAKMLFDDKINSSGGINADKSDNIDKTELFSYIYYLWYYNKSNIYPFTKMHDGKHKASGDLFYNYVNRIIINDDLYNVTQTKIITQIDVSGLIYFINKTINENYGKILIPIIDHLQKLLKEETQKSVNSVGIKTGNSNNNMLYQAKLLNEINSDNADIKIKFFK